MTHQLQRPVQATGEERTAAFENIVRTRRSYRGFLDQPIPQDVLNEILIDAQWAPSNCNTQPWETHIVSGEKLKALSRLLHEKSDAGELSPDFTFDIDTFSGDYKTRQQAQGKAYYEAMGVARDDKEGRQKAAALNYSFFNAPHVALLFMPSFGDNVRVAGDIGMYGQTFLLSLEARGLGGIPQTSLGFFADTIREFLGISSDYKMLFGISFGHPDEKANGNRMLMNRVPIKENVTFHS